MKRNRVQVYNKKTKRWILIDTKNHIFVGSKSTPYTNVQISKKR